MRECFFEERIFDERIMKKNDRKDHVEQISGQQMQRSLWLEFSAQRMVGEVEKEQIPETSECQNRAFWFYSKCNGKTLLFEQGNSMSD